MGLESVKVEENFLGCEYFLSRRKILKKVLTLGTLSSSTFLFFRPAHSLENYQSGEIAPRGQRIATSALLTVSSFDLLRGESVFTITGQGHSHKVKLYSEALAALKKQSQVVVRSAIGGDVEKHSHWVQVRLKS